MIDLVIDTNLSKIEILQAILRLLASKKNHSSLIPSLLTSACQLTSSTSAIYIITHDPQKAYLFDLTDDIELDIDNILNDFSKIDMISTSDMLPQSLTHIANYGLVFPIFDDTGELLSYLVLFAPHTINPSDDETEILSAIADALTIVTHSVQREAYHDKLARNQYEFVRIVSHDLRSPLTSLKGFASMLESNMVGELNDKQEQFVEKILSGVSQMTSLVDNIQDAGRYDPETGFYEMERTPTDIVDIVSQIVENHLVPAEKEAITVSLDAQDDIPIINVDSNMLERSITNLVDNAIKYTPNGGMIRVIIEKIQYDEQDGIVVAVADDGYGISEENQQYLFERHYRIRRREHKRVKGSGLGLFIVRSVAQQHQGDAWVVSEEGHGSTFNIFIPLNGQNLLGSRSQ